MELSSVEAFSSAKFQCYQAAIVDSASRHNSIAVKTSSRFTPPRLAPYLALQYVIVDEGHRLKNFDCRLVRELRQIPAANRLLLTGTPLQNSLAELWALLNYLMPDVFSQLADFEDWFDFSAAIGRDGADEVREPQPQAGCSTPPAHLPLEASQEL
eukprot:316661-Chlamydomonas_euryale.AAC.2